MASRTDERDYGEVVSRYEKRLFELGGGETESLLPTASHYNRTIPRIAHLARKVTDGPVFLGGVASLRERCIIVVGGGAGLEAAPKVRSCREGEQEGESACEGEEGEGRSNGWTVYRMARKEGR